MPRWHLSGHKPSGRCFSRHRYVTVASSSPASALLQPTSLSAIAMIRRTSKSINCIDSSKKLFIYLLILVCCRQTDNVLLFCDTTLYLHFFCLTHYLHTLKTTWFTLYKYIRSFRDRVSGVWRLFARIVDGKRCNMCWPVATQLNK